MITHDKSQKEYIFSQVVDRGGGHYYNRASAVCEKCTKWDFRLKSCAAKNTAAADEDCHEYGVQSLDKKKPK